MPASVPAVGLKSCTPTHGSAWQKQRLWGGDLQMSQLERHQREAHPMGQQKRGLSSSQDGMNPGVLLELHRRHPGPESRWLDAPLGSPLLPSSVFLASWPCQHPGVF